MSYFSQGTAGPPQHPSRTTPAPGGREARPDRSLVDTRRAAKVIGMSRRTLEKWRALGKGPPYLKLGRRVLYSTTDLEAWLKTRRRVSTSDF